MVLLFTGNFIIIYFFKYYYCTYIFILYLMILLNIRNPVAQSTDGCRGKIGFKSGRHAWEIIWEGPLGTVAVVGIATKDASLLCHGYLALLGSDKHSWGWNLVDNHLLHNGDTEGNYPLLNNAPKYQVKIHLLNYQLSIMNLFTILFFNLAIFFIC